MPLVTATVQEGAAKLRVPKGSLGNDPFHQPVFYNPRMEFNRSVSSLALGSALPLLEGSEVLDGLCSLGARGLRYLLENKGVSRVTFVDANPPAIALLERNLKLNKVSKKRYLVDGRDLTVALANSEGRFDFVEVDPFGSPVFYLDGVMHRLKRKAVLSITTTDLANLYGAKPKPALRHYDARPLHVEYGHELALRILLGRIVRTAAVYDYAAKPLLSFYEGHAAKCVVFVERSAPLADEALRSVRFLTHCPKCLHRETGKLPRENCAKCGAKAEYAGPLWISQLGDDAFLKSLIEENGVRHYKEKEKLEKFLSTLLGENDLPVGFYDLHHLSEKLGVPSPRTLEVLERLRKDGFKAVPTHYLSSGVKADAPAEAVLRAVKAAAEV